MLEKEIVLYFDGIEPDEKLIERVVAMSENTNKEKRIKLSTKLFSIIVAAVLLLVATTATATIIRIKNDDSAIVQIDENESFVPEFSKAQRAPEKLSSTSSEIVKAIADFGINDIVIPSALINDGYEIVNKIPFLPQYTSAMLDFSNGTDNTASMIIIQDIADEDIDGFWGTGDKNSEGQVVNVNSMDVVIVYMGDSENGYSSIIFYANGNTIYQLTYFAGFDEAQAHQITLDFVNSLAQ